MSEIYELIGRAVVQFVRRRYAREIRAAGAAAVLVAALGLGAWFATREEDRDPA